MIDISLLLASLETEEQRLTLLSIFHSEFSAMYGTAYEILQNQADAEDAAIIALYKIHKNINRFISLSAEEQQALIITYTRNAAIDVFRKREHSRIDYAEDVFVHLEQDDDRIEKTFFENLDFGSCQQYVTKLPDRIQDILLMRFYHEMTNKEIAAELHMNENTVNSYISRALKKLRKMMEADGRDRR